jgi:dethiobiotin synthetase
MLFVTGTDTGVGKTFFTVSLVRALRELGVKAVGFKPVETGCTPECQDAKLLSQVSGVFLEPIYSFRAPVAPSVASELEGIDIEPSRLVEKTVELAKDYFLVVEGAGGIMVPITWNYTFLDFVRELRFPTLVVALNKLGVINHTLLTVEALISRGVEVKGVVLNSFKKEDESFESNLDSLYKLLSVPLFSFSSPEDASAVARFLLS